MAGVRRSRSSGTLCLLLLAVICTVGVGEAFSATSDAKSSSNLTASAASNLTASAASLPNTVSGKKQLAQAAPVFKTTPAGALVPTATNRFAVSKALWNPFSSSGWSWAGDAFGAVGGFFSGPFVDFFKDDFSDFFKDDVWGNLSNLGKEKFYKSVWNGMKSAVVGVYHAVVYTGKFAVRYVKDPVGTWKSEMVRLYGRVLPTVAYGIANMVKHSANMVVSMSQALAKGRIRSAFDHYVSIHKGMSPASLLAEELTGAKDPNNPYRKGIEGMQSSPYFAEAIEAMDHYDKLYTAISLGSGVGTIGKMLVKSQTKTTLYKTTIKQKIRKQLQQKARNKAIAKRKAVSYYRTKAVRGVVEYVDTYPKQVVAGADAEYFGTIQAVDLQVSALLEIPTGSLVRIRSACSCTTLGLRKHSPREIVGNGDLRDWRLNWHFVDGELYATFALVNSPRGVFEYLTAWGHPYTSRPIALALPQQNTAYGRYASNVLWKIEAWENGFSLKSKYNGKYIYKPAGLAKYGSTVSDCEMFHIVPVPELVVFQHEKRAIGFYAGVNGRSLGTAGDDRPETIFRVTRAMRPDGTPYAEFASVDGHDRNLVDYSYNSRGTVIPIMCAGCTVDPATRPGWITEQYSDGTWSLQNVRTLRYIYWAPTPARFAGSVQSGERVTMKHVPYTPLTSGIENFKSGAVFRIMSQRHDKMYLDRLDRRYMRLTKDGEQGFHLHRISSDDNDDVIVKIESDSASRWLLVQWSGMYTHYPIMCDDCDSGTHALWILAMGPGDKGYTIRSHYSRLYLCDRGDGKVQYTADEYDPCALWAFEAEDPSAASHEQC